MCTYKTGLGSECESDSGCPVKNAMCSDRKCVCKPLFIRKGEECLPGEWRGNKGILFENDQF